MKIKKMIAIFVFAICLFLSGMALTACSPADKIEKISNATGFETAVKVGNEFDTSNISVTIVYKSGKTKTITNEDLTFSQIDTSQIGQQTLTITYGDYTFNVVINVTEEDPKNYTIVGFDDPSFITTWNTNSKLQNTYNKTGSTGVKGFAVIDNPYLVGNDNAFIFAPTLHALYANGSTGIVKDYKAEYKVYLHGTGEPTLLSGDTLESYVAIADVKHTLNFTDAALDKTFTISVLPAYLTEDEADVIEASTFTFKVVDGYNVYNAADLSVFDNVDANGKWTAFKQAKGLDNIQANALILQSNITINESDLPARHFWKESEVAGATDHDRVLGSLKDSTDDDLGYIYSRKQNSGTFKVEGNYFQISAQNIPLAVRERGESSSTEGDSITVHTTLFGFFGDETGASVANYELNNISLYGNTKKTEDATLSGGILGIKTYNCNFTAYNNLAQCWFIMYFNDEGSMAEAFQSNPAQVAMNLKSVNAFDAYNSLLYNWGGVLNIEDCVLIGAGGPVMICDHAHNNATTGEGGVISEVTTKNSILESYVAGSEGWFVGYNATELAGVIKALDQLFNQYDVTILDKAGIRMNLVAVYKSSEAQGLTNSAIRGTFRVADYDEEKTELIAKLENILEMALAAHIPGLTEQIVEDVLLSAEHIGLDMDISAASFRYCVNDLVTKGLIPSQEAADYIYNAVMVDYNILTQDELLTKLMALVGIGLENAEQAYGISLYAKVCAIGYGRGELATVLDGLKTYQMLTEEEVDKILLYAQKTDLDASKQEIKTYLEIIHALGQMTDGEYAQALGAIYAQAINGAFGLTSTTGWALEPNTTEALTSVTFTVDCEYLYIYLPNGMSVVFTLTPCLVA